MAKKIKKQKKDLDKAYAKYTKMAAEYGIDPKSKDEFRRRNYQTYRVKWSKKRNTNFQIAKTAIQKQLAMGTEYQAYLAKFRRAKKKGFIIATEAMPEGLFYTKRTMGSSMQSILGESYQINMKQSKSLLMEAKQLGIKMSLSDLLRKGERYQELMQYIKEHGWQDIEGFEYPEEVIAEKARMAEEKARKRLEDEGYFVL